jgi:hypothetical protein
MPEKIGERPEVGEFQGLPIAVYALELPQAGNQVRLYIGGAIACRSDEPSGSGTDALNRLGAERDFLNIDSWG